MKEKTNWYNRYWVIALLLFIFFPAGLYALYKTDILSRWMKLTITGFMCFLVGMAVFETPQQKNKSISSKTEKPSNKEKNAYTVNKTAVWTCAKHFTRSSLKSANIEFPWMNKDWIHYKRDQKYVVELYDVKVENRFGATRKHTFLVKIKHTPQDPEYLCELREEVSVLN